MLEVEVSLADDQSLVDCCWTVQVTYEDLSPLCFSGENDALRPVWTKQ